jgi:hypothetical protein
MRPKAARSIALDRSDSPKRAHASALRSLASSLYNSDKARWTMQVLRGYPENSPHYMQQGEPVREVVRRLPLVVNFNNEGLIDRFNRTIELGAAQQYSEPTYLLFDGRLAFVTFRLRAAPRDAIVRVSEPLLCWHLSGTDEKRFKRAGVLPRPVGRTTTVGAE